MTSDIKAEHNHKKKNDYEQGKQPAKNSTQSTLEHYSFRLKNGGPIFREKWHIKPLLECEQKLSLRMTEEMDSQN